MPILVWSRKNQQNVIIFVVFSLHASSYYFWYQSNKKYQRCVGKEEMQIWEMRIACFSVRSEQCSFTSHSSLTLQQSFRA